MKKYVFLLFISTIFFISTAGYAQTPNTSQMAGSYQQKIITFPISEDSIYLSENAQDNGTQRDYDKQELFSRIENALTSDLKKVKKAFFAERDENGVVQQVLHYVFPINIRDLNIALNSEHIPSEYYNGISATLNKSIALHPDYFYISNTILLGYTNDFYAATLYIDLYDLGIDYTTQEGQTQILTQMTELRARADEVAAQLSFPGMTDLDKILLVHDYIIDHNVYYLRYEKENGTVKTDENGNPIVDDSEYTQYNHTAYGALVSGQSVCEGYAKATQLLLRKLGISPDRLKYATSEEINHMWNLIEMDGAWYHYDATHDDPTVVPQGGFYDMDDPALQIVDHKRVLASTQSYQNSNNFDWGASDGETPECSSTKYEQGYLFNNRFFNYQNNNTIIKIPAYTPITYDNGYFSYTIKPFSNANTTYTYSSNSLRQPAAILSLPYRQTSVGDLPASLEELPNSRLLITKAAQSQPFEIEEALIGFYDKNNVFLGIAVSKLESPKPSNSPDEVQLGDFPIPENAAKAKLFAWDALSGMRALSSEISITKER